MIFELMKIKRGDTATAQMEYVAKVESYLMGLFCQAVMVGMEMEKPFE